jgi:hypothetical protein
VWQHPWRKRAIYGGVGLVVVTTLVVVGLMVLSPGSSKSVADDCRERLYAGGFTHELTDGSEALTGTVWAPPKGDATVIFQEVTIVGVGGRCKSITADVYASKEGKGPKAKKQPLGTFAFKPGGGVEQTDTKAGAPQPLVDRARKEFEQMTTAVSSAKSGK